MFVWGKRLNDTESLSWPLHTVTQLDLARIGYQTQSAQLDPRPENPITFNLSQP